MDTSSPCTCFQLRRAARRVSQVYDHHLAAADLSLNAYSILRRAREPRSLGELADALGMDRTTLSRNLKPLVDSGLLASQPGKDSRQRRLHITAAGRRRLKKAFPLWQRAQEDVEAAFGSTRVAGLNRQLEALTQVLDAGVSA
ncbi:MarR family winged helix-turn-helix transcriptional regulator [Stenotrophomonas sp. SY1]|uniref:MarR family winged helix-turn-helix transcriptional regulator n=1 Tax=Stenotrophomonas sp. SY1 TaxID=477235 RepID=UPI001E5D27FF|nr:MarR family winged helix-turn-helix transcriptional regulator [Stenotrophomonas sp. SY1]MCD9087634.1 MarR family winged helix-turn-helix transcriptional regulator [Stenotrophomonas sp. SY1]